MNFVCLRGVSQDPTQQTSILHWVNLDLVTMLGEVLEEFRTEYPDARTCVNFVGGGPYLVVAESPAEILSRRPHRVQEHLQ
jgi:hypothetical protein